MAAAMPRMSKALATIPRWPIEMLEISMKSPEWTHQRCFLKIQGSCGRIILPRTRVSAKGGLREGRRSI